MREKTLALVGIRPLSVAGAAVMALFSACSRQPTGTGAPGAAPLSSAQDAAAASVTVDAAAVVHADASLPPEGAVAPKLSLRSGAPSPGQWTVEAQGFPAISEDGKRVALLFHREDGLRGYPDYSLVVKEVDTDKLERQMKLLDPNEIYRAESAPGASPSTLAKSTQSRLEAALAFMAKTRWVELVTSAERSPPLTIDASLPPLRVGRLVVTLANYHLQTRDASGRTQLDRPVRNWKVSPYTAGPGLGPCEYEPYLSEAAVDETRRVLVLRVSQSLLSGGDWCNEPSTLHAFRLSPL